MSQDEAIGRLTGEGATTAAGALAKKALEQGGAPALFRGVVIDVLHDPSIYDDVQIERLANECKQGDLLYQSPRNTCVVQIVTNGQGTREDSKAMVCFPFFPPYLGMPIKPGEHVWVFVEDSQGAMSAIGYWICRISEANFVDDINYTHSDRAYGALTGKPDDLEEGPLEDRGLGFYDGADVPGKMRFRARGKYEQIYSGSLGMQSCTLEPVPRWTKRPGDFVIQGSNNTLISLGEDRGYTKETMEDATDAEWSSATNTGPTVAQALLADVEGTPPPDEGPADPNPRTFAGTIDIVAGRGRYPEDPDAAHSLTAARVVTNARGYDEVDKNAVGTGNDTDNEENRLTHPSEGDPDFHNDASRIYVSMNTLPDFNFGIEYPQVPKADDPANVGNDLTADAATEPNVFLKEFEVVDTEQVGQAAIVIKSDEIRVIARQDTEQDPPIQGSITLIKEGTPDDEAGEGRGIITIRPDGVIMIDGPKIVIGSGIEKGNGEGNQVCIGLGASDEPMVLGQQLVDKLTEFANKLNESMTGSVGNLGAPVLHPVYSGWVAGWIASLEEIKSKVGKLL